MLILRPSACLSSQTVRNIFWQPTLLHGTHFWVLCMRNEAKRCSGLQVKSGTEAHGSCRIADGSHVDDLLRRFDEERGARSYAKHCKRQVPRRARRPGRQSHRKVDRRLELALDHHLVALCLSSLSHRIMTFCYSRLLTASRITRLVPYHRPPFFRSLMSSLYVSRNPLFVSARRYHSSSISRSSGKRTQNLIINPIKHRWPPTYSHTEHVPPPTVHYIRSPGELDDALVKFKEYAGTSWHTAETTLTAS